MKKFKHLSAPIKFSQFLTKAKIRHFGALSALVKDSRQFKQREERLLKVVTVNLLLYKQLYNTKKLYFLVRRLSNGGEAVPQKLAGKLAVRKAN